MACNLHACVAIKELWQRYQRLLSLASVVNKVSGYRL
jgi:hypothetical protein